MSAPSTALIGPNAGRRLEEFGLTAAELESALQVGYSHAAGCTSHDPRSLAGTLAWGKGIGHLRDLLKPRGWSADRSSNYETVVHPTNVVCVTLAAGTSETGRDGVAPRTRAPKGPATSRAVRRNRQLSLGVGTDVFEGTGGRETDDQNRETWLLLHYYDEDAGEIRHELSCPEEMSGKHITAWRERILLDPIAFESGVTIDVDIDADEPTIDIDVKRRAD